MASRVEYAVSLTPIRTVAASGDYAAHDVMATDINGSLGASSSVSTTAADHATVGYASGAVAYKNAIANGGVKVNLGDVTANSADGDDYKMVFIKHTGYEFGDATTLGATANTAQDLIVYLETSADLATSAKFTLPANAAVCIPNLEQAASCGIWCESSGANTIAVEYALIS